jgi:hypothetical protein
MNKRLLVFVCIFNVFAFNLFSQENNKIVDFGHRLTLGGFYSYTDNNIGILEPRYDFIINVPYINPKYNLIDFGIGISVIMAFDGKDDIRLPVFGFGLNGSMRIYTPYIKKARLFTEGIMSLVLYTRNYPENGTKINGGWHIGGGFEYSIEEDAKIFSSINWFHNSNNDIYGQERNPSINAIGFMTGIQFNN